MTLTSLTSSELKTIARLLESKEQLVAKLAEIDRRLADYESGCDCPTPGPEVKRVAKVKGLKRRPRGAVKQAIIDLIKGRGRQGITVKEIAAALGFKANRVYTWFYGTGNTVSQIRKIGEAKYRWSQ